ncbi:uncharacterized protein LAJ45_03334 [Morchella importuna]|uniref:uncharacterized protein n=1 Tax=Morchella importuna TaxID=1174673 RepID=UPI001E8E1E10|nr:uncharacterized protein LAJ45_03334 [Morchella importuna]KAH8152494.1 hypothetical protein LAJ45_03334 [Morchella importuna]
MFLLGLRLVTITARSGPSSLRLCVYASIIRLIEIQAVIPGREMSLWTILRPTAVQKGLPMSKKRGGIE